MTDTLRKFMFEHSAVRGELVELVQTWQQVQARRSYPAPVRKVLGEMMAAAALLSANLKFNGAIVMQIHGDGPVKLLVVECDSALHMRATAKLAPDVDIDENTHFQALLNQGGQGRFVITLDPKDKLPGQQPYQGIVPLDGDSISVVLENYMLRSEQLDTKLWLAADEHVARGLLLQKLPHEGGTGTTVADDDETWNRTVMLASTTQEEELLTTDIDTLLRRLFWEETIRLFEPMQASFECGCTREKVGNMLRMLGKEEVDSAIAELGKLSINCDFCGQDYAFDSVDCAQLFAGSTTTEATQEASRHRH